jgi:hypothetical protein
MPLRGGSQRRVPAERASGGEALASTHPWACTGGVDLGEQGFADAAVVANATVEHRLRQHHLPFTAGATDADVGVLGVEQGGAVAVLQLVEGFLGIPGTDDADAAHRHRRISRRLQSSRKPPP